MAFDPNLYAIQIALSIDAGEAFKTVSDLEGRVNSIEDAFSKAMTQTLGHVATVTSEINSQLEGMTGLVTDINAQYAVQFDQISDTLNRELEQVNNIERIQEIEEELYDLRQEMFESLQEFRLINEQLVVLFENQRVTTTGLSDVYDEMLDQLEEMGVDTDNIRKSLAGSTNQARAFRTEFQDILRTIQQSATAMYANATAMAEITKMTERFVTANYRAYGTQHQLMEAVTDTASEFGVLHDATAEAYEQLMGIRVPIELLEQYAGMVTQTSRISGAGTRQLADYTRTMAGSGLEAGDTAYVLSTLTAAQEQFGLTTDEVNKILAENLEKLGMMTTIYGSDIPRDMAIAQAAFAGLIKQTGASAQAGNKLNEMLYATGQEAIILRAKLGAAFNDDTASRFDVINDKFGDMGKQLYEAQVRSKQTGESIDGLVIALGAQAKAMGGSYEMVDMYARAIRDAGGDLNAAVKPFAEYERQIGAAQDRQRQFTQSINTLYFSVQSLTASLFALVQPVIQFIARGMIPLIQIATFVVDSFVSIIDVFTGTWTALEGLIPPLAWVRQGLEMLVAAGILLGPVIGGLIGLFSAAAGMVGLFAGSLAAIGTIFSQFTGLVQAGLANLGQLFISFMTTIGTGLARLGSAVAPVMLPLLALGGALLMVGASAYLFAQATVMIAQEGWAAVGVMFGLVAAIGLLGLALVGLGMLAQGPVALGLLAVGAALLMVGGAVYLVGAGIGLAANGMAALVAAVPPDIGVRFVSLAAGLTALSLSAWIITPGLLVLGVGLAAIAIPAYVAGIGLTSLASAMESLQDITFPDIGGKMLLFALDLAAGALILGAALIPLTIAGAGLYMFAQGLQALQGFEVPDLGGKLIIMAGSLVIGAYLLGAAIAPLIIAGAGLWAFAQGLKQMQGLEVPDIGPKLIVMAGSLALGAYLLGAAVWPLIIAGAGLYAFATGLQQLQGLEVPDLGGKLIVMAGSLALGAYLLGAAVAPLILAGAGLYMFAQGLEALQGLEVPDIGPKLIVMAGSLSSAAVILGPAVIMLSAAGVGLWVFAQGLKQLQGLELEGVGDDILSIAIGVGAAAYILGPAAGLLTVASVGLAAAGVALGAAGISITVGAISLGFATSFLNSAIDNLDESADVMERFTSAAERFNALSFSALSGSVRDLGNVANNMVHYLRSLTSAAEEMNDTQIDAKDLAASISEAAILLDVAAQSLANPTRTLTTQINGIVEQVERLIAAEAQIREIGGEISDVVQQPREEAQQPNEMRVVEKVTEAVNALVEVKQDNSEMVALLARLVELMEKQANNQNREGFFQNEAGEQPSGKKFHEAGVKM